MEQSVLISTKRALGLMDDDVSFDSDVIMHLNSVVSVLIQIGVPVPVGFVIENDQTTWDQLLGKPMENHAAMIKSYVYARVRILFDPPTSSFGLSALREQANEFEWRIYEVLDPRYEPHYADENL